MTGRTRYFLAVREAVNAEDPYDLLSLGAPDDEYDTQVECLVKWRQPVSVQQVQTVFENLPHERAARLAVGIEAARVNG